MRSAKDIILNLQILDQEFDRSIAVCFNAADSCCREDDDLRFLFRKKFVHRIFFAQIELGARPCNDVLEPLSAKQSHDGATDESQVTGNIDFVGAIHAAVGFSIFFCPCTRNPPVMSKPADRFPALPRSFVIFGTIVLLLLPATASTQSEEVLPRSATASSAAGALIPWLLQEKEDLRAIPFSEVIFDATGRHVLTFNSKDENDGRVLKQITSALDEVMKRVNAPDSVIREAPRINEVSSHFEDLLRELLNATAGLACDFPRTADGRFQRSGYPDLRLVDEKSRRIYYLDPKLYAIGSRDSSFRSFYFEPRSATNKVLEDAVHFVVGFEHAKSADHKWAFTRWDLVDLSAFKVKLKAEFQASNRDLYHPEAIVASSAK
jgi:hypothetical protein